MKQANNITLLRGPEADATICDQDFITHWLSLYQDCPNATLFQRPGFVCAWYGAYREEWEPVLIVAREPYGNLTGLWLLAWNARSRELVHAGASQAEYHTWLVPRGGDSYFLSEAWGVLKRTFPFRRLHCKYLPSPQLVDALNANLKGVEVRWHIRPILRLNQEDIRISFAKKSNKSKFNRLNKLGNVEFRRITNRIELEEVLDELIDFYDFRQGAVNKSTPFKDDRRKRDFHLKLFSSATEEVLVTVMYLSGRPIAAYWGLTTEMQTHLGMLIHSPFLAEYSPGKLHIMQLSKYLLESGRTLLDLTPGGDAWKERFANNHDEVAEAVLHVSQCGCFWHEIRTAIESRAKRVLGILNIRPDQVRSVLAQLRRVTHTAVVRKVRNWTAESREFRIYRADRSLAQRYAKDTRVQCNCLADLLLFRPCETWQTRDKFLSSALNRLEQGQSVWTIRIEGRLSHYGWMATQKESRMSEVDQTLTFPPGSVTLYDFYSMPDFRGLGLYRTSIGHMLQAAFADESVRYVYISVLANNGPSRHVIESMGFAYQGAFYWQRCLGRVTKWADEFPSGTQYA